MDRLRKGTRWQRTRIQIILRDPLCCRCQLRVSEIVDHIVPARVAIMQARMSGKYSDRYAGYYLRSNLQGLCRPCHWEKTVEEKTHSGPWPDVVETERLATLRHPLIYTNKNKSYFQYRLLNMETQTLQPTLEEPMSRTMKELKAVLNKLESLIERFETAGFDQQAEELDAAAEVIESLISGLEEL